MSIDNKCSLCGARYISNQTCRERFELCLAMEYENPATYGTVHHLTVPCYMLQHNGYSQQGWLEAWRLVDRFINGNLIPEQARKDFFLAQIRKKQIGSITRGKKLSGIDRLIWSRTIFDVVLDDLDKYSNSVRLWAASLLIDSREFVESMSRER